MLEIFATSLTRWSDVLRRTRAFLFVSECIILHDISVNGIYRKTSNHSDTCILYYYTSLSIMVNCTTLFTCCQLFYWKFVRYMLVTPLAAQPISLRCGGIPILLTLGYAPATRHWKVSLSVVSVTVERLPLVAFAFCIRVRCNKRVNKQKR